MEIVIGYWNKSPDNINYFSFTHCKNIVVSSGLLTFEYLGSNPSYKKNGCYETTTDYIKFRIQLDKVEYIHIYS